MTGTGSPSAADVADLHVVGHTWLHRIHPLTKLAVVLPLTVLGFVGPGALVALSTLVVLTVVLVVSRLSSVVLTSMRLLAPITIALFVIHGVVRPYEADPILEWGIISISSEGLQFALTTAARLGVFVLSVTAAMATVHPKVFSTALIQRGVSHKLAYAYLAGAELLPEMKAKANHILEAQQSRGFDVRGNPWRRLRTLFALLKPLVLGALIGVEMRTLALESRGFSRQGPRTSTAVVEQHPYDRKLQASLLLASIPILVLAVVW